MPKLKTQSRDIADEVARIDRNLFIKRAARREFVDVFVSTLIVFTIALLILGAVNFIIERIGGA